MIATWRWRVLLSLTSGPLERGCDSHLRALRSVVMGLAVLLLGGSAEARELAELLERDRRWEATVSYAEGPRVARHGSARVRVGGFGGAAGFLSYLRESGSAAVVDATHPFAERMAARTARVCAAAGVARLKISRAGWTAAPDEDWIRVADAVSAAETLSPGVTVFAAAGREVALALGGRGVRLICRGMGTAPEGFEGEWLRAAPPFSVEEEIALFRSRGVRRLVVKDSGGAAGRAKLEAARALGIPVTLIDRPPMPPGDSVATAAAAFAWLDEKWLNG